MQTNHLAGLSAERRKVVGDQVILLAIAVVVMVPELVFGMSNTNSARMLLPNGRMPHIKPCQ